MTIQATDIKLLASERLTDTDDGGGKMTGNVIESGAVNNLFADISRLDRTYGRLSLRKVFMAVTSASTDAYLGAHMIITDPPSDDKVAVTLFSTGSDSDERIDAEDRIESYLTSGPLSPFYLYGNQPVGAKAITLFGRVETPVPSVGDVYVLSVESGATVTAQQYVRIADVQAQQQTFTDSQGDYTRQVITLTLTGALLATYQGAEASRLSNVSPPTLIRTAVVADASTYFGVSKLSQAATANALSINVASISSQLVPATTREVAVAGATPGLSLSYVAAAVAQALNTGGSPRYQARGVYPGSLKASVSGGTATDDGGGNVVLNGTAAGAVDYESGRVSGININGGTYIPAAAYSSASYCFSQAITIGNQGTVYVATLPSLPAPGTLSISFRYLGKWYTLSDSKADGTIAGDSATAGGGSVDYTTGNVTLTLGAIPDVGSRVIYLWGDPTSFTQHAGDVTVTTPVISFRVQHWPIKPGSASLSWLSGGVTKTAAVATDGTISGDGTGTVRYLDGTVILVPSAGAYPDSNAKIDITYTQAVGMQSSVNGSYAGGQITFTLPAGALPLVAGAVSGGIAGSYQDASYIMYWKDDGAGNIVSAPELSPKSHKAVGADNHAPIITVASGTINYTTGEVTIQPGSIAVHAALAASITPITNGPSYAFWLNSQWAVEQGTPVFVPTPLVQFNAKTDAATETAQIESVDYPGVSFVLTPTVSDAILPGSVWFTWGGKTYIDRAGNIYRDLDPGTGSATLAGTIDYANGAVTLSDYGTSTGGNVALVSLLTQNGIKPTNYAVFRTPGAPLRAGSFYVQAIRTDTGAIITATSDANGNLSASFITGTVDNQMGWAEISFGSYVPAAGNENEPWYNPTSIVGSNVWKPIYVDPTTIKFNCVVQTTLPLDASLLGIDPVRLPLNGTVPIFRDGNVIVVHDDRTVALPAGFGAGSTYTVADAPLSQCTIVDATGAAIDISNYTVDMDTGLITGTGTWDVSSYTGPFTVDYTVEDMLLATSVELTGQIQLGSALSRDYPQGAKVSSALLFGDLQATNAVFFSQMTWQNMWSDTLSGSGTTAQYNRTTYPIKMENANAVNQRWALIFTSTTGGNIVGETLGQIGTFNTGTDAAPVNPLTNQPYFTLVAGGWGSGWGVNNVLRFNTTSANAPLWVARTILPGAKSENNDGFRMQTRGDAN